MPAARDDIGTLVPALESKQAVLTCRAAFALEIGVTDTLATAIAPSVLAAARLCRACCLAAWPCAAGHTFQTVCTSEAAMTFALPRASAPALAIACCVTLTFLTQFCVEGSRHARLHANAVIGEIS